MGLVLFWVQAVSLLMPAVWLSIAVRDNLLYPSLNGPYVAQTLAMEEMRRDYPDAFEQVAHRSITDTRLARVFFCLAIAWEILACLALWGALAIFLLAFLGLGDRVVAQTAGLAAAMVFTATWGGFLIVGNHFCYWYARDSGQPTHFQMLFWGIGTTILLAQHPS
jgi:hypothetical protein